MALKIRPGLISVVFPFSILASMSKEPAHFLVIEASRKLGLVEIRPLAIYVHPQANFYRYHLFLRVDRQYL